jgi:glycosyltransferase involved in cell wall biosynthesis
MRILMLLKKFPPDIRVEKEARTLLKAGHELSLLSLGMSGKPSEEIIEGLKVIRTDMPSPKTILRRAWDEFRFAFNFIDPFWQKALVRAVEQEKPEALHIHDLRMVKTGLSVAQAFNIPLVADLHENFPEALRAWRIGWRGMVTNLISPLWRWKRLEKYCVYQADRVITVVDEGKEHYVKDCGVAPEKVSVVMNTVDLDYFYSLPVKKEIVNRYKPYFTISYTGDFAVHRGIQTAITAMPDILREIPNALLLLIGSGPNEAQLRKLAGDLGLSKAIEFCGRQPFALMPSYIAAGQICLVPHIASGHADTSIAHKLFQYMAMAKPVVVSSAKPLARVVEETGAGLVYRSEDADSLAEAIIKINKDRKLAVRLGKAGQKAVKERYNWQKEGEKLLKLYQDLGGGLLAHK